MRNMLLLFGLVVFAACVSDPKRPDGGGVRVSHDSPGKNCEQLDQVIGTSATRSSAYENALKDIKREAASRGGNYVKILAISSHGSAIRGMSYRCN